MRKSFVSAGIAVLCLGIVATAYAMLESGRLVIAGKEVSTDYILKNGRAYVPVSDVAKALNMSVQKVSGGYELAHAGGANQVEGLNGSVGDQLSCGAFLLKLTEVSETDDYACEHTSNHIKPFQDGTKLVVLKFHVKNATKVTQSVVTGGGDLTSLTDDAEHSYTKHERDGDVAPDMLAIDFALVYYVPQDTKPGDMIYQLHSYSLNGGYKDYLFRISLKK